jgi:hypothetical protein
MLEAIQSFLVRTEVSPGPRALLETVALVFSREHQLEVEASTLQAELSRREGRSISAENFRKRLSRLNTALRQGGATFALLSTDGRIRAQPNAWHDEVAASAGLERELGNFFAAKPALAAGLTVLPRAVPERPSELLVMFSYAWLNRTKVGKALHRVQDEFCEELAERLANPLQQHRDLPPIRLWRDAARIDPADQGSPQMDEACRKAFLGLLLISHRYPHSPACMREADHFLTEEGANRPGKMCIVVPVNVRPRDVPERFSAGTRIWGFDRRDQTLEKAWDASCAERSLHVSRIAEDIFAAARAYLAVPPRAEDDHVERRTILLADQLLPNQIETDRTVDPRAVRTQLTAEIGPGGLPVPLHPLGVEIVKVLADWACSNEGARLTALLGEFGMGKTVTCQLLTRELVQRRERNGASPLPMYFDLRNLEPQSVRGPGTLERVIGDLLYRAGEAELDAKRVIAHIRRTGATVIFDGIDEVTNRLSADEAIRFYRELLTIVPVELWRADAERRLKIRRHDKEIPKPIGGPRILVSCRSHYFRDLATQRSFLIGQDRAGLDANQDIQAFVMLPFSEAQIRQYLDLHLGSSAGERAWASIGQIYNLDQLSERPILLRFVSQSLAQLEEEKRAGRTINLARIYDIFVTQTFSRDDPKHVIPVREKTLLLEALACEMHRQGVQELSHEALADWFIATAPSFPRLAIALNGLDGLAVSEIFLQDLRNASLLVRHSESGFRFSHTSIREYFLANAIVKSICDGRGSVELDMPPHSLETLTFVLARLAISDAPAQQGFRRAFPDLLAPGQPKKVRRNAFALWRHSDYSLPRSDELDLSGLEFHETRFAAAEGEYLPFQKSRWKGTLLLAVEFHRVDLSDADFSYAEAGNTHFVACITERTLFNRFVQRDDARAT